MLDVDGSVIGNVDVEGSVIGNADVTVMHIS